MAVSLITVFNSHKNILLENISRMAIVVLDIFFCSNLRYHNDIII